ncbi:MAG: penicillin acylase family protein [Acidobacteriia bacterium]|nr:penicillin acylase family protein [Terriglobia bacterium]
MKLFLTAFLFCTFLFCTRLCAEKVEILRDEYGVPHIFAATDAGVAFGSGYAQAEDRLEELMRNFRKAEGTMAEAFGEEWFRHDVSQRRWGHRHIAATHYKELGPKIRSILEAYVAGIRLFIRQHPEQSPSWAVDIQPWHPVALGRYTISRWPEGEAASDLRRAGIEPDPVPYAGSNQMLIAPKRTAMGAPIAVIDPHLSWYGETRYYEMRLYGGALQQAGGGRLGLPFPTLGHSRYCSVAMTTGGPDTSDVFEEEIKDGSYRAGPNVWKPLRKREERIGVRGKDGRIEWRSVTIESTHHGPIWAHKDGKSYSFATPYLDQFRLLEQAYAMVTARNLTEMKTALAMRQYMAQNIMAATVDGDIFYLRNGRVPIRAKGCDPSKPMPGTGACEWLGIHPIQDLVQIANPDQGYMQNNNCSPWVMMRDSPLVPERYAERPYLYNDTRRPASQRAAMTRDQLDASPRVTIEQALDFAFSPEVYKAETWQSRIREAAPDHRFAQFLSGWNRRADADSGPALGFYLFKMALGEHKGAVEPPATLTDQAIREALEKAFSLMRYEFSHHATWGTLFRVGREGAGRTFPVSGGGVTEAAMATPRNITFKAQGREMVGVGGQTQTMVVILTKPPQSFQVLPLGQSDHKNSGHFDDQAEKLFSKSKAKPTFFLNRKELEKHLTSKRDLNF